MNERESISPKHLSPAEAEADCDALRASERKLTLLYALCWGIARTGFLCGAWLLIARRGDYPAALAVVQTLAIIPGIALAVIALGKREEIRRLLPRFLPADAQTAFDECTQALRETKAAYIGGWLLLIPMFLSGMITFLIAKTRPLPQMPLGAILVSGACFSLCIWLVATRGRVREEAITRARLCAEPVTEAAVRRIFGEDAAYRPEAEGPFEAPHCLRTSRRDRMHTADQVSFERRGCPVTVCDAAISTPHRRGSWTTIFRGILAQIRTNCVFGEDITVQRVSDRKRERLADALAGGPLPIDGVYRLRGRNSEEARAVWDALLTEPVRRALLASDVTAIGVRTTGIVELTLRNRKLIKGELKSVDDELRHLEDTAHRLLPLIDAIAALGAPKR